ncbi:MAG: sigma-70 family RNA polymerase sigma factor, partial [Oscillospiraceae bacterium]|nr:sigma-70 family RNA polymerase sigma factor [Oscillospiraceae bacterium]
HAEELETHPNVVGWLIVTMKNRAMTAQRELDKQARIVDELSRIAQFPDTMDISLMELIETLSPADQEILTLYYVKNSKLRKITSLLDISESAAKVRLFRARRRLEALGRDRKIIK